MVNEEIIGGLISALSRGESLEKAMMTFYNAGYQKEEIEDSAKVVYSQVGAQIAKTGFLQNTFKTIASKVGLVKKNPPKIIPKQNYQENNYGKPNQGAEQISEKIVKAIKDLKQVNFPSKIEIVTRNIDSKSPTVVQKISDYKEHPPKQISKVVTYLLVFILILLLGILAAVFFFKDDLIKIFNNLGLG